MKKTRIDIVYAKRKSTAIDSIPWVEGLSEYLKIDPEITVSCALDGTPEADLIISPMGTGHNHSKSSRALSDVIKNSSCPKLIVTKGIFSGWGNMTMTFSYIDSGGHINLFPKKRMMQPEHIRRLIKRKPTGFSIQPWKRNGDYFLFCAQNSRPPYFSYYYNISYNTWAYNCIQHLLKKTDEKIIYRFHPRKYHQNENLRFGKRLTELSDRIEVSPFEKSLQDDFEGAKKVFTYNSGVAIKSVFAGIPTVVGCRYFTGPTAVVGYENFKKNLRPNRTEWFYRLAHTTWSNKEVLDGKANSYIYELGMKKDFKR